MLADASVPQAGALASAIAWIYLVTNAGRVITYVPQILAVLRATDGARAVSLLTWSSWVVSHAAAILYGVLVIGDTFFTAVSAINFACCTTVTLLAAQKRRTGRPRALRMHNPPKRRIAE